MTVGLPPGGYPGAPPQQGMYPQWLSGANAMQNGGVRQGGMMGRYQPPQRPQMALYNPVGNQFQYSMPQYQGNPFLPGIMK